jgi:hypothetical protein
MDTTAVQARRTELRTELQQALMRVTQLRASLDEATALVERLRGACALADEMLAPTDRAAMAAAQQAAQATREHAGNGVDPAPPAADKAA